MKFIKWVLSRRFAKKLTGQQHSTFKLKLEADAVRSACISEIQTRIEPLWLSLKAVIYKLGIKDIQHTVARITRTEHGNQLTLPIPVFSADQAARIKNKHSLFSIIVPVFITAEAMLYFLTAALFVPGAPPYLKALVALFLALLFMLSLNVCFEKHFAYREAVDRHHQKELSDFQLTVYRDQRNFGYLLGALSFAAIIFAGLSRIFFLEHPATSGLDEARLKSIQAASKWGSLFTMLVTITTAVLMGILKQEQRKISEKYRVLEHWTKTNVQRNTYTQDLIKHANTIILIAEQCAQKHWQLLIEVKRALMMEDEFDHKYKHLYQEYSALRSRPEFIVTDHIYTTFSPIQAAFEELFTYGILHCKEIKGKIDFALSALTIPEAHIAEHVQALHTPPDEGGHADRALPTNGQTHKHAFIHL